MIKIRFKPIYAVLALLLFITEVLIALYVHDTIIRPYGGDFLVVIFMYCVVMSVVRLPVWRAAVGVLMFAYMIEGLQYLHLIDRLGLSGSTAAQLILGSTFMWGDMLAYTLGTGVIIATESMLKSNRWLKK